MAAYSTSWVWFCEDCGLVGVFQNPSEEDHEARKRLHSVHGAASPKCRGCGLKVVSREDMRREKIIGRMRRRLRPIIVSYFTNETYEAEANKLASSVQLLRLDHEIEHVPGLGTWKEAVLHKPLFIKKKLLAHPDRDIVWVDADAIVLSYPEFLMVENPDFDLSYYVDPWGKDVFGGTVFYRNTPAVHSLVDEWAEECKNDPLLLDERSLDRAVRRRKDIVLRTLPVEYCWVERWFRKTFPSATPIIEQYAISRPAVNPVRLPV